MIQTIGKAEMEMLKINETHIIAAPVAIEQDLHFWQDILQGLSSHPKYLPSKYFYDAA